MLSVVLHLRIGALMRRPPHLRAVPPQPSTSGSSDHEPSVQTFLWPAQDDCSRDGHIRQGGSNAPGSGFISAPNGGTNSLAISCRGGVRIITTPDGTCRVGHLRRGVG
jgi:hypothetical protein